MEIDGCNNQWGCGGRENDIVAIAVAAVISFKKRVRAGAIAPMGELIAGDYSLTDFCRWVTRPGSENIDKGY